MSRKPQGRSPLFFLDENNMFGGKPEKLKRIRIAAEDARPGDQLELNVTPEEYRMIEAIGFDSEKGKPFFDISETKEGKPIRERIHYLPRQKMIYVLRPE